MNKNTIACMLVLLPIALVLPGAARSDAGKPAASAASPGFLADYSALQKHGLPHNEYRSFKDPSLPGYHGKAIYLTPIVLYPSDATFPGADEATVTAVLTAFDQSLRGRIAPDVRIVDSRAAADVVLEVALTHVVTEEKGKTVVDLVPVRAVTNAAKEIAFGEPLVAATSLEARLVDRNGKVLAALMQHSPGKGIGRSGDPDTHLTVEALRPAIEASAKLVADQMAP